MNLSNDRWRHRAHETVSKLGIVPDLPAADRHHDVDDRDLAVRLLEQLPARQREVVVLRHYAGLTEQETAETLGISLGTVKSTCHQALSTLRRAMHDAEEAS
ncbi:sigma-70 family RNA polymerase sigma factor [Flexivirga caeni]|uniref:sigma-70 family RNA polymerase sigma factor n=1 Tax=Flexivirga caeni TaxID=2294115 RepID=UPI001315781B|nr:sigma-70 family RNA polymerase sigma factor [Flexivirga caeni]